ncbi:class I SAM-dependent methyltransferase [Pseudalkalibacillus sp. Hm43]|uniref:class I SAM-dependent methyltransferase n=1 Tax=Pseudalkalibacillus sp. Hm43 TaxID=3450742 RepID=UPI003F422DE5
MEIKEKEHQYIEQFEKPFEGWDFSFLIDTGRVASEPLPWSYGSKVLPYIRHSENMLDMGTGGGELLSKLQPLPQNTWATEGYAPNLSIATGRLTPLGVSVVPIEEEEPLPFHDEQFDLIINKHESYSVKEVMRILKPGGRFITQQVGGQDATRLNELLGEDTDFGYSYWTLEYARKELEQSGFEVEEAYESFPYVRFYDIGAVLYHLKAIPWQVPNFSVQSHLSELMKMEEMIQEKGYLDVSEHRFYLSCIKPK